MRIFRNLVQLPFSLQSLSVREMASADNPNLTKFRATVPAQAMLPNEILDNDTELAVRNSFLSRTTF